jgi:integrase
LVVGAVDRFGMKRTRLTSRVPLGSDWAELLARVENKTYLQGVKRLAHYCSALGIAPDEVRSEILIGLHEALVDECMTKEPRKVIKHTIAMWNHFGRTIPEWPRAILGSPFATEPDTLPLERFPESFRSDVTRWTERVGSPHPLDPEAPVRALKPATIKSYVVFFRRFASALVRREVLAITEVTSLAVFFERDNFREGLRHFLAPDPAAGETANAYRIAQKLSHVARHYVQVEAGAQKGIDLLCRRLDPNEPRVMGRRNRDRLDQFDDAENVGKLLAFPEAEAARALKLRNAARRARGIERALAVSLLIFTGLRIKNLRHIRHAEDIRRSNGRAELKVAAANVKNGQALEFELQPETLALLDLFLAEHRTNLPGSGGPYLFPGMDEGPKSDNAMRAAVSEPVWKHCGLTVSPHLYRHIIAKIVVERDPGMYIAVSRHLGHRSMSTTLGSYLGTETRAAGRRLGRLLTEARENPELEDD